MTDSRSDDLDRCSLDQLSERLRRSGESDPGPPDHSDRRQRWRAQFSDLSQRWRTAVTGSSLGSSGNTALRRLAERGLSLLKLLHPFVAAVEESGPGPGDPRTVEELLDGIERLHDRLRRQCRLVGIAREASGELHEICAELLSAPSVPTARLRQLGRRVVLDVPDEPEPGHVLPEPGLRLAGALPDFPLATAAAAYARGVQTARLLVWSLRSVAVWNDRLELLTAAALLQDVGVLSLEITAHGHSVPVAELVQDHRHPAVGAALVAGLQPAVVELPLLLAAHHERVNGTGYPGGADAPALPSNACLLTAAVRAVELWDAACAVAETSGHIPDLTACLRGVSRRLCREAAEGALDGGSVAQLLSALDPATVDGLPPHASAIELPAGWRHDGAGEQAVPTPHWPRLSAPQATRHGALELRRMGQDAGGGRL